MTIRIASAPTARTFPDRAKPKRITGMWLRHSTRTKGKVFMTGEDPETLKRFTFEADLPKARDEIIGSYDVYVSVSGQTSQGQFLDTVDVQQLTRAEGGSFFAFVDIATKRRYLCYENTLPPREGQSIETQPTHSLTLDLNYPPKPYIAPAKTTEPAGQVRGTEAPAGTATVADPVAEVKTGTGADIPF